MNSSTQTKVVIHADLTPALRALILEVVPEARFVSKADFTEDPNLLANTEILFTQQLDPRRVAEAKHLRWVQTYGAGVEWLLSEAVVARSDLRISNARGIHAQPIAEHVFGLILAHARGIDGSILLQQKRDWNPGSLVPSLRTLEDKALGIIGLGAIGRRIAEIGKVFGLRVIGTRNSGAATPSVDQTYGPEGLTTVLRESDYIINALPLTAETRGVFDRAALAQVKPDAVLVNIGRGGTIDTEALVDALRSNKLGAALLDVTDPEPLPKDHALWGLPNVIITPHYSGAHPGYGDRVTAIFVDNVARYRSGQSLLNEVDKEAGY